MMLFTQNDDTKTQSEAQGESRAERELREIEEDYRRYGIEGKDEESMDSIADVLSTFDKEENTDEKKVGRSDLAKKKRWIPILAVCAAIGLLLYFFVLKPMLKTQEEYVEPPEINTWLKEQVDIGALSKDQYNDLLSKGKCEVVGTNNRVLMFAQIKKEQIKSVEVHNALGSYTFYRDDTGEFTILGAENTSYSAYKLSSLVVSSGYTLSLARVSEDASDNLAEYGLSEADDPAYYILTTTSGVTHTVYIGDEVPMGNGYYCRYEDRPAVYVLDSSLAATLLSDVRSLMTPLLVYPVSQQTYYTITNFKMLKNGERFLEVNYLTEAERTQKASASLWEMVYPEGGYTPSSSSYDAMLQSFAAFVGTEVLEYNVLGGVEELTDEQLALLESYGLTTPATALSFDYTTGEGATVTSHLLFSAKNEDDTYYVYSALFDLISKVNASDCKWLEYDLLDFINRPIFNMHIDKVQSVEITSGVAAEKEQGKSVNTDFRLSGEGSDLFVTEDISAKTVDTKNFRQLYKVMLTAAIDGYTEDDSASPDTHYATMRVTTRTGVELKFDFYAYNTRRCYMTINGAGEFYVPLEEVRKLLSDAQKVVDGVTVDADARN